MLIMVEISVNKPIGTNAIMYNILCVNMRSEIQALLQVKQNGLIVSFESYILNNN